MFEDGARLDDILNVLKKKPTLDNDKTKKIIRISDESIRYDFRKSVGTDNVQIEFGLQKNMGVLP